MQFTVNPAAGVPIYEQLAGQVRAGVARGQLRPDDRLPSVREMSQTLVVNPNTIARAYSELEREGTLYTRPGMGVFIATAPAPLAKKARRDRLAPDLDRLLVEAVRLGFSSSEMTELVAQRVKQFEWQNNGD
jgi:GntR family transcriptional regulator